MEFDKTRPAALAEQMTALRVSIQKTRLALQATRYEFPTGAIEGLSQTESALDRITKAIGETETQFRHMLALTDIGKVVNSTLEIDEVLRIVMDNIVGLSRAERGFLMLKDENGNLVPNVARNWEKESINSTEAAVSRTVIQKVVETGEAILTTNAQEDPRLSGQESIIAFNLRSILCVPLKVKNDLIGVIYADNRIRSGIFTETERDLLSAFANQAAVAIDNARLFSSLKKTLAEVTALKNLMENVFASITSGVITTDVQEQVTLANRAAESILGRAAADLLGHNLDEALAAVSEGIRPHIASVRQTDSAVMDLEFSPTLPTRGHVDWRFNLSPLKDESKKTQGIAIVLDDLTERKHLEAQRKLFERMVSPAVINQLDPNKLQLGGKRAEITTIFADIRGFTTFSEKQSPEKLVAILNRYLAAMAEAVLAQEGTIDKFMGDAIMAWFNAPIPQPDHTLRAVRAALAIRASVENLYTELPPEAHLAFGAGIHTGEAVLGLIGTEKRLEYTAISDSVNTAKRIQENSARNQILLSRDAYERVKDQVNVNPVVPMSVKGKTQPLEVYELVGLKRR
ncbi:MAG: GAF domain-containing protein [Chloroflexi bacterium]|nr:GAF domain-containing protein [Chloroflexota bacterium]